MPEIPDVAPGEIIESGTFGNPVLNRIVQRYADGTARDAGVPLPQAGQLVWLDDPGILEAYDGTEWVPLDELYGGPFLPLAGGEMAGTISSSLDGTTPVLASAAFDLYSEAADDRAWIATRDGDLFYIGPRSGSQSVARMELRARNLTLLAHTRFTDGSDSAVPRAQLGRIEVGDSEEKIELRLVNNPFTIWANNAAGTAILEYLRISKAGTTPRVSYRGSASTSTAVANATWFTSNEITSGSRSIGQAALSSAATTEPGPAALDADTDPVVSALRQLPVRRGRYRSGYLVPGDPREGVDHPMIVGDELEALAPEAVDRLPAFTEDGDPLDDEIAVNVPIFTAALLSYVQSLEARIAQLEAAQP